MVAYVDDFKLMLVIAVLSMPMVLLLRPPRSAPVEGQIHAIE
jgi:hypothetical protein